MGAAESTSGELAARAIVKVMYPRTEPGDLTETLKQMVSSLGETAAGLTGGLRRIHQWELVRGQGRMRLRITI